MTTKRKFDEDRVAAAASLWYPVTNRAGKLIGYDGLCHPGSAEYARDFFLTEGMTDTHDMVPDDTGVFVRIRGTQAIEKFEAWDRFPSLPIEGRQAPASPPVSSQWTRNIHRPAGKGQTLFD